MGGLVVAELADDGALSECASVIRRAFATVAQERGFTQENAPTHTSFITEERVRSQRLSGTRFFGVRRGGRLLGCVALEVSDRPGTYYLERLAVLPSERHQGLGQLLVEYVVGEARRVGARESSIAIVDDDLVLKRWYEALGFRTTGDRQFEHLPFTVCYLACDLTDNARFSA